jgi:hypothetical protein
LPSYLSRTKIVGAVQDFGKVTVVAIWASPVLLSATGSVCAATVPPHTTAKATASTPSGVPLN